MTTGYGKTVEHSVGLILVSVWITRCQCHVAPSSGEQMNCYLFYSCLDLVARQSIPVNVHKMCLPQCLFIVSYVVGIDTVVKRHHSQ